MSNRAGLNATITGGTITDGGKVTTFSTPINDYLGNPLYCKISVSGSTLIVLIDKDGPNQLGPIAVPVADPATRVAITVRSQAFTASWAGELASPYKGEKIDFRVEVTSNMRYASFALAVEGDAALAPAANNVTHVGYIAIADVDQPGTSQIFFLTEEIPIVYNDTLTASIIPPGDIHGGIGGPMGIGLP
jgi:hypothetical protein